MNIQLTYLAGMSNPNPRQDGALYLRVGFWKSHELGLFYSYNNVHKSS